jgi:hypothetical protein
MLGIELEIDTTDFDSKSPEFLRILAELSPEFLKEGGEIFESQMKLEVPVSSGRLQTSIYQKIYHDYIEITTNSGYGKAVDEGRRGFTVYPVNAKVLRFFIGSKIVFARVSHPGPAKGNHFIERTLLNGTPRIQGMMNYVVKEKMSQIT